MSKRSTNTATASNFPRDGDDGLQWQWTSSAQVSNYINAALERQDAKMDGSILQQMHRALFTVKMVSFQSSLVAAFLAASALTSAAPAPLPTPAPDLSKAKGKRATSCTFSGSNGYSLASVSQKDCATIVLSALSVPSGVTLNLSDLEDDTAVS